MALAMRKRELFKRCVSRYMWGGSRGVAETLVDDGKCADGFCHVLALSCGAREVACRLACAKGLGQPLQGECALVRCTNTQKHFSVGQLHFDLSLILT